MSKIVGRERQVEQLEELLHSSKSELVVIYGRRRVGKTFLIRETYKKHMVLEVSGIPDGSYSEQLTNFYNEICAHKKAFAKKETPQNWLEAFNLLGKYIDSKTGGGKKVVFIDEFPWMYTHKSKFIQLFSHFWNSYCSKRTDLIVVICGSAASFMVNKVMKDPKGLHHRITLPIRLLPFNLYETALFLKSKKVNLDRYSYLQLYMAVGGIPHYLEKIHPGDSVPIAIDRLCFDQSGLLVDEFNNIFASLFDNSENHIKIVEALATSQKGITRDQLIAKSKISSGGTLSRTMEELSESGFISEYQPYSNASKQTLYRLTDEYSMFYLKYIKNNKGGSWKTLYTSRSYASWSGFAFENLCLKHDKQILIGLGINGIDANSSSWRNDKAQIDLIIERSDRTINICELKFSEDEFTITKSYADTIRKKKKEFTAVMKGRKNVFVTFVTTFGVKSNSHSQEVMDNQITMDSLFEKSN
jgi:AAA+ ATPase superfamily predicted ATPase